MGSFATEAVRATSIETGSAVSSFIDNRQASRSNKEGRAERSSYDVVGINATKVPAMREAIRTYVKGIHSELDKMNTNTLASRNKALQSEEVRKSVDEYIGKVKRYSQDLTSYILTFSDKLKDVQDAWEAQGKAMASNINSTSGAMGANSGYTEKDGIFINTSNVVGTSNRNAGPLGGAVTEQAALSGTVATTVVGGAVDKANEQVKEAKEEAETKKEEVKEEKPKEEVKEEKPKEEVKEDKKEEVKEEKPKEDKKEEVKEETPKEETKEEPKKEEVKEDTTKEEVKKETVEPNPAPEQVDTKNTPPGPGMPTVGDDGLIVLEKSERGQDVINKLYYDIDHSKPADVAGHAQGTHTEKLDAMIDELTPNECAWVLSRIENEGFGQTGAGYSKATPEAHQAFIEQQLIGRYGGDIHELLKHWGTYSYTGY